MGRFRRRSARIFWKEGMLPGKMKPPDFSFSCHYVYKNTHLSYETFFPLGSAEFEGIIFSVPNHARQYLQFFTATICLIRNASSSSILP